MTFPSLPTITRQLPPRQLASFPHSGPLGLVTRLWLWWLRLYMNQDRYKLTLKGRTPRRNTPKSRRADVSLKWAKRVGLYVDDKMESKWNEYNRAVGQHDERIKADKEKAILMDRIENQKGVVNALRQALQTSAKEARQLQADGQAIAVHLSESKAETRNARTLSGVRGGYLKSIHLLLDGQEWDSETTSAIAEVLTVAGYTIRSVEEWDQGTSPEEIPEVFVSTTFPDGSPKPSSLISQEVRESQRKDGAA